MRELSSAHTMSPNTGWTLHGDGDGTANSYKSQVTNPQFSTLTQRCVSGVSAHVPCRHTGSFIGLTCTNVTCELSMWLSAWEIHGQPC